MRATTEDGRQSCRGFQVIVSSIKGLPVLKARKKERMSYPIANGTRSIACMKTLIVRGFDCVAMTGGRGEEETLTLEEMEDIVIPGY